MASYYANGKYHNTNLLEIKTWHFLNKAEFEKEGYDDTFDDALERHIAVLTFDDCDLKQIAVNGDPAYPEGMRRLEMRIMYADNDRDQRYPIVKEIVYPAYEEDDPSVDCGVLFLTIKERLYFTSLLRKMLASQVPTIATFSCDEVSPIFMSYQSDIRSEENWHEHGAPVFTYTMSCNNGRTETITVDAEIVEDFYDRTVDFKSLDAMKCFEDMFGYENYLENLISYVQARNNAVARTRSHLIDYLNELVDTERISRAEANSEIKEYNAWARSSAKAADCYQYHINGRHFDVDIDAELYNLLTKDEDDGTDALLRAITTGLSKDYTVLAGDYEMLYVQDKSGRYYDIKVCVADPVE